MAQISVQELSIQFGGPPILDRVSFQIHSGERVCVSGRNGEGKSTLLRILAGEQEADSGSVELEKGLKIARLMQEVPADWEGSVFSVVAAGDPEAARLLEEYERLSHALSDQSVQDSGDASDLLTELQHLQEKMEQQGAWDLRTRVESRLSRMELDGEQQFAHLSGGQKRRVLLARALLNDPDVLMLDEPTNHLDIPSILWLEEFLLRSSLTLIFVTHDRSFARKLSNRVLELDRGQLRDWSCSFDEFQKRRQDWLENEKQQNELFDKRLAEEEKWIRKGIQARRTRNEGRVRSLLRMRTERQQRRSSAGSVNMEISGAATSGRLVLQCKNLSYRWDDQPLVENFSTTIMRGDRVGVLGPNGSGKTTLVNLLLGKIEAHAGTIRHGANLEIAYFDQHRRAINEEETLIENIGDGKDTIMLNGRSRHVMSYLQDFLFSPERARSSVGVLSGGERNRLLLARLFSKPSNVLVLDEPTNDLDAETLDLLEDQLLEYPGTVLLVSHDRAFLDNVVTSTIVVHGNGDVMEYVGGYQDWVRQTGGKFHTVEDSQPGSKTDPQANSQANSQTESKFNSKPKKGAEQQSSAAGGANTNSTTQNTKAEKKKLSYKETRELETLPELIENLESKIEDLQAQLQQPEIFTDHEKVQSLSSELAGCESQLEVAYERWEELSE